MSLNYDYDEKDYYQGDSWGGSNFKSIYQSVVREKFTLDEDEDVDVSPHFDGSPHFGGSSRPKVVELKAAVPKAVVPQRTTLRFAFGGNPLGNSDSDSSSGDDSDGAISLDDLLGSDTEVSEGDVEEVKTKFGGSIPKKSLNNYQAMRSSWHKRATEESFGKDSMGDSMVDHRGDSRGDHRGDHSGDRHGDHREGFHGGSQGNRTEIPDYDHDSESEFEDLD